MRLGLGWGCLVAAWVSGCAGASEGSKGDDEPIADAPLPKDGPVEDLPPHKAPRWNDGGTLTAMPTDDEAVQEGERLDRAADDFRVELDKLFGRMQPELNKCYLPQLKRDPSLQGHVVVKFQVKPGGKLSGAGARVDSATMVNEDVQRCVLGLLQRQAWPEPFNGEYTDVRRILYFGSF
jgi:hypothetical protein